MYSSFRLATKYLKYYITASNGKGHGIHSPFVFDFVINVLNDKRSFYAYKEIEELRHTLLSDNRVVEVQDMGAGSVSGSTHERKISSIARSAAKPKELAQLLYRIVSYYQPQNIIELGTSLGISSAYLSSGNPAASLLSFEGAPEIARIARDNFSTLGIENINLVEGNFDNTLSDVLNRMAVVDFAFVDGNHRKEPTLRYFKLFLEKINDQSILIFDDIHWSSEMEEAWNIIKNDQSVSLSIDLFFLGIVFFRKDFKVKQDFIIRF
jgi:predicted O-methyltransferase YrrM